VTALAAVVPVVALVVLWWRSTRGLLAVRCRREVIVTLRDGASWAGVLLAADGDVLVLARAVMHFPDSQPVPADGEVVLLRSEVRFLQIP
jgi:hypothetical protein